MDLSQLSTADLEALQAGNLGAVSTEGLQALNGGPRYGTGQSYDVTANGSLAPSGSAEAQRGLSPVALPDPNATQPVTSELGAMVRNIPAQAGLTLTNWGQGLRQMLGLATPGDVAAKRQLDAPLANAPGALVGRALPALPLMGLSGGYLTAAGLGGLLGAMEPTGENDSRALNTGIGVAAGLAGKGIGEGVSNWLEGRAAQPFMGWSPRTADATLAQAVGSDAANLGGGELGAQSARLGQIFQAGRDAATDVDLSATPQTLDNLIGKLNPSVRTMVENNPNVTDLLSHATGSGTANGQLLGNISTGLRQDAYAALNSEGGSREVGLALNQIRNHVEDLIQSNIADPGLRAAYTAARPQYGLLQDVRYNPSILNASTGRANMEALGKYLQRNNPAYTAPGAGENDLFNAAMWGQAGGGAKGMPAFSLSTPWKLPLYALTHNPVSAALGGATSRLGAPIAPALRFGLPGGGFAIPPTVLPELEQ